MSNIKIAMIDNNNVVSAVLIFNGEDLSDQGAIAGMLSNPECFEVSYDSEATIGWKHINGVSYPPEQLGEGL